MGTSKKIRWSTRMKALCRMHSIHLYNFFQKSAACSFATLVSTPGMSLSSLHVEAQTSVSSGGNCSGSITIHKAPQARLPFHANSGDNIHLRMGSPTSKAICDCMDQTTHTCRRPEEIAQIGKLLIRPKTRALPNSTTSAISDSLLRSSRVRPPDSTFTSCLVQRTLRNRTFIDRIPLETISLPCERRVGIARP